MKKAFILFLFSMITGFVSLAQVGINANGTPPDPSAFIDAKSTTRGALLPRMTAAQRNAIPNPADGLMVFCSDCGIDSSGVLCIYANGTWTTFRPCITPEITAAAAALIPGQIVWNWNSTGGTESGYKWNTVNNFGSAIDVGLSRQKTETSVVCSAQYTRYVWACYPCGISVVTPLTATTGSNPSTPVASTHTPSLTSITWNWNPAANAIGYKWNTSNQYASATDLGLVVGNSETGLTCGTGYTRYLWAYSNCGISAPAILTASTLQLPGSPAAGSSPSWKQILWSWNTVPNASGYKWNTANNFGTAQDMGTSTSKTETGLECGTSYTRYVWSYSACGTVAAPSIVTASTLPVPPSPSAGTNSASQNSITWNWLTVPNATGYKWNTSNNYATATDMGIQTTKLETGLNCGNPYSRYIWSYSVCGTVASPTLLTQSTLPLPPAPAAGTHETSWTQITWRWNNVPNATGYKWNSINDYQSAEDLGINKFKTETGLETGTTYTRYVWSYSSCLNIATPTILTAQTRAVPECIEPIYDTRDGQSYTTVLIGYQCWMGQNLNIGTKINGSLAQSDNGTIEKYCYNNLEANCDIYGGLYQWNESMQYSATPGAQGICPTGLHIPTYDEWFLMLDYLGGIAVAGGQLKEAGSAHWYPPNPWGTNSSGFTGLPGGYKKLDGTFNNMALEGNFWASAESDPDNAWEFVLWWYFQEAITGDYGKSHGFSVRCVKD